MALRNHLFQRSHFTHEKNEASEATQLSQGTQPVAAGHDPKAPSWTLSPAYPAESEGGPKQRKLPNQFPETPAYILLTWGL